MSNPITEIGDGIIAASKGTVQIQVLSLDEASREMLSTAWMVEGNYFDVSEKITSIFGKPIGSMSVALPAVIPAVGAVILDENTHIQLGESDG